MTKVLVSEENLTNIADSIRSKLDVETTYKPGQMSAAIDSIETGGGLEINGKKENFIPYGAVLAGDFVRNRNTFSMASDESMVSIQNAARNITTVALDENRVFVTYLKLHNTSKNYYGIYGVICTIDGTTVTSIGEEVTIFTPSATGYHIVSAVKLTADKVFIALSRSSNTYPIGRVCTIDGSTITVGTSTTLASNYSTNISVSRLTDNKVFIAYASAGDSTASIPRHLKGIVCTIDGTTITSGTDTTLIQTAGAGAVISAVCLDSTKVFIAHSSDNTNYYLNGLVCNISDTTITAGTDTTLVSVANYGKVISGIKLYGYKVFIAYSTGGVIRGTVCTISGTTITAGSYVVISSYPTTSMYTYLSTSIISGTKVLVMYKESYICGRICNCPAGTEITMYGNFGFDSSSGATFSTQVLNKYTIFVAHSSDTTNYYLNGVVAKPSIERIVASDSNPEVVGVANATIAHDTLGEVWVPNF